jgi:replication factor C subunit 3/5
MINNNEFIPLMERWRPTTFDNIILDPLNKIIMKNIIETSYFPNLLFYGPPGTGKTTSVINIVKAYQEKTNQTHKGLIIHLNASDERGIDIIRIQINQFVNSKSLFNKGMKFVILDEIDSMTKNAQLALRYLIQNYSSCVRFCLICNYISRIDDGLQNECLKLRFNQLPEQDIIKFLTNIVTQEKLNISENAIAQIQKLYKSDIRSMINFIQLNQTKDFNKDNEFNIIGNNIWEILYLKFTKREKLSNLNQFIQNLSRDYNIDKKNIIKDYLNYIIRNKPHLVTSVFLTFIENITHIQECKNSYYINYVLSRLESFIPKDLPS